VILCNQNILEDYLSKTTEKYDPFAVL